MDRGFPGVVNHEDDLGQAIPLPDVAFLEIEAAGVVPGKRAVRPQERSLVRQTGADPPLPVHEQLVKAPTFPILQSRHGGAPEFSLEIWTDAGAVVDLPAPDHAAAADDRLLALVSLVGDGRFRRTRILRGENQGLVLPVNAGAEMDGDGTRGPVLDRPDLPDEIAGAADGGQGAVGPITVRFGQRPRPGIVSRGRDEEIDLRRGKTAGRFRENSEEESDRQRNAGAW